MKPSRGIEREINDLENWIATVNEYLDVLEYAAQNAESDALARAIGHKIAAQLRRLASLHARRDALRRVLSPEPKTRRGQHAAAKMRRAFRKWSPDEEAEEESGPLE